MQNTSNDMMIPAPIRTCPRKGQDLTSTAENKLVTSLRNSQSIVSQIRAYMNASERSSNRHVSTSTVQRRLCESDLRGQITGKKPLPKEANMKKRTAWTKKDKERTLDQWKSMRWSDESKFDISGSDHRVFTRRRKGKRMVFPPWSMEDEVWWWLADDTVGHLFEIEIALIQHHYHSIPQWRVIQSLSWTVICFSIGQWPKARLQAM